MSFWIIWVLIAVVLSISEIIFPSTFFLLCLAMGALCASILDALNCPFLVQCVVFIIASVISVYLIRPALKKILSKSLNVNSNVDELIGKQALVLEKITPQKSGIVKVLSEVWLAKSKDTFEKGEKAIVVTVDGTKLVVKK